MQLEKSGYALLSQMEVEHYAGIRVQPKRSSTPTALKWAVSTLLALSCLLALFLNSSDSIAQFPDVGRQAACPQYPPTKARSEEQVTFEDGVQAAIGTDGFLADSVERMQGAIKIPTESFDDMGPVGEDSRWDIFVKFHEYLEDTFPLVYSRLKIEKINTYGIVITWKGSEDSLKPYLFMAHQDVVPVLPATYDKWTYEPYSAHYDGQFVWGRGAMDCKHNLIGIMESFEALLHKGFEPQRTLLAGIGFDEEISGPQGARFIAKHLEEVWGKDSIELILDEGGLGMKEMYGKTFALPALGEKGYFDVKITVETPGGHSSIPQDHTGIGLLAQVITTIEDTPYTPDLTPKNPIFTLLQCAAEYSPDMDSKLRKMLKKALTSASAAKDVAKYLAGKDIGTRYLLQTSQAVDIINGGVKINALPEKVFAVVNHRIAVESNVAFVREHMTKLLEDRILGRFNIALDAWGHVSGNTSSKAIGKISLTNFDTPLDPAPVSPFTTDAYKTLSGTIKQVLGEDIIVAPAIMTGNTDTRYYWNLSENIYRFSPVSEKGGLNIHTVDERLSMKEHIEAVKFYAQLMLNSDRR